ncbi:MAG: MBL fold metallo-hydrolase [Sandaracinaceae bacterium]|nr:MAG: MBL fold metallo-hydrolase [Sandaracinaceae bacterium]
MDLGRPHIAILDVGHGNCAVLRDSRGAVVIDVGPGGTLLDYLQDQGITSIDLVLVSHADADHIGGLIALIASKEVSVGEVRLNSDAMKGSKLWQDLTYELSRLDDRGELSFQVSLTRSAGKPIVRGDIRIEVLAPSKWLAARGPGAEIEGQGRVTSNTISAVIRVLHRSAPVALLTGDMDALSLKLMGDDDIDMSAPVLVFPHHGGSTGGADPAEFTAKLLGKVSPNVVLFSLGRVGRGKVKPQPEIVSAIKKDWSHVRLACTQLSQQCRDSAPAVPPSHLLPIVAKGRERRFCCAGTVVIALDATAAVYPDLATHGAFIAAEAPSGLCK